MRITVAPTGAAVARETMTTTTIHSGPQQANANEADSSDFILGGSPITSLPPELLEVIFTLTLPPPDLRTSFSTSLSPMNLTHVCRRWRTIAIALPLLWSSFTMDLMPFQALGYDRFCPTLASLWLERGRNYPLSIRINHQLVSLVDFVTQRDLDDFNACLRLLCGHSKRWTELFIAVDLSWFHLIQDPFHSFKEGDLDSLQIVHYLSTSPDDSNIPYYPMVTNTTISVITGIHPFDHFWHILSSRSAHPNTTLDNSSNSNCSNKTLNPIITPLHLVISGPLLPPSAPWLHLKHISFKSTLLHETCSFLLHHGATLESIEWTLPRPEEQLQHQEQQKLLWSGPPICLPTLTHLKLLLSWCMSRTTPSPQLDILRSLDLPYLQHLELWFDQQPSPTPTRTTASTGPPPTILDFVVPPINVIQRCPRVSLNYVDSQY